MLEIVPFAPEHIDAVKRLTDQEIGEDYYSSDELKEACSRSQIKGINCSYVLTDGKDVFGIRITYPPGKWTQGKSEKLSESLWPHPLNQTAYFQSLFIHKDYQKQGWGRKMSRTSIEQVKKLGGKGIVCHSWKESPGGSSQAYLKSMGFKAIAEYPLYWKEVDYTCPRCGKPCLCTAQEMYLDFNLQTT